MKDVIEMAGFKENEIKRFTASMRKKLLDNQRKGRSWLEDDSDDFLEKKLHEEVAEWVLCKNKFKDRYELADIANICMMLFLRQELKC